MFIDGYLNDDIKERIMYEIYEIENMIDNESQNSDRYQWLKGKLDGFVIVLAILNDN